MGVQNFQQYKLTEHARDRIYDRFNITKNEMDSWLSRLLSQSTFVEDEGDGRKKYRLNDIVVIVNTKQQCVVTVYSENEHDDIPYKAQTNPEVKSVINDALKELILKRKIKTARKLSNALNTANNACSRMIKPGTNYRFIESNWDKLISSLEEVDKTKTTGLNVINEAEAKIKES